MLIIHVINLIALLALAWPSFFNGLSEVGKGPLNQLCALGTFSRHQMQVLCKCLRE